jgi:hypothetical protein
MKTLLTICFFYLLLQASMGQNVGIGTTSPQRRLDVIGGIRADSLLLHSGTGENTVLSLTIVDVITFAQNLQADYFVSDPLAIAQSVTAEVSDTLHYISVFTSAPIQADTIKIYEGEGLSGPLLASATMEEGSGWVKSSLLNLYLEEGDQYTFWLDNVHYVYFTVDDAYPDGGVIEGDSSSSEADLTFSLNKVSDPYVPVRVTGQGDYPNQLPSPFPGAQMELNGHLSVTSLSLAHGAENGSVMTGDSAGNFSWKPLAWTVDQYGTIKPSNPESYIALGISNPYARFHIGGSTDMMIGNANEAGHPYPFTIYGDGDIRFLSSDGLPRLFMNGEHQNIGIGTFAQPGEKLSVGGKLVAHEIKLGLGATEGHVLTSDAFGNASWQSPAGNGWSVNAGDHIYNTTTGNVGIGTFDPTEKLQVEGKILTQTFQMTNGAGANHVMTSDAAGIASWAPTMWSWNGANVYSNAGNVGIGNSNPAFKLDVTGMGRFTDGIGVGIAPQYPLHVTNSTLGTIALFGGSDVTSRMIDITKGNNHLTMGLFLEKGVIGMPDGVSDLELWTNSLARVTIKPDGKVGIGTASPTQALQVAGMISTTQFQMTYDPGVQKVLTSDANGLGFWTTPVWQTNGSNMYSTPVGFVGLGTNNPTEKLHILGNAIVTGSLNVGSIQQSVVAEIPLAAPFSNWGGDYEVAGYYKDKENVVHLQGLLAVGTPNAFLTIYQLPAGFRPAKTHVFAVMDANSAVRVDVDQNGNIKLMDMTADAFLSLDGISFRAQ